MVGRLKKLIYILIFALFASSADADILFYDDCEDDSKLNGSIWGVQTDYSSTIASSTEQKKAGNRSYKFYYSGGAGWERSELVLRDGIPNFAYDTIYWVGYSIYIPSDWNPDSSPIHTQFHAAGYYSCPEASICTPSGGGFPFFATITDPDNPTYRIRAFWNEEYCDLCDWSSSSSYYSDPMVKGAWNDVVMQVRFTRETTGIIKMWLNGDLFMDYTGRSAPLFSVGPSMKIGIYASSYTPITVYYDEIRIGDADASYADVAPGSTANLSPSVTISPSSTQNIVTGDSVYFTCGASDPDGTIASYAWDFGGAGIADPGIQTPGNKQFDTEGIYTVTVTATDDDGAIAVDSVVVIVSPTSPGGLQYSWLMEASNIAQAEVGGANLTWYGSAAAEATGTEPYVGLGTHGVPLNGSTQYASATLGASAPWESGQPIGTVFVLLQTPATDPGQVKYLAGKYNATGDDRSWAVMLSATGMTPMINIGVNSGADYEAKYASQGISPGSKYAIFASANATTKVWAIYVYDFTGGQWIGSGSGSISGDMNLGASAAFNIGRRSDGSATTYFGGTIYLTRLYNTILSSSERESIVSKITRNAGRITTGYGRIGAGYGRMQ